MKKELLDKLCNQSIQKYLDIKGIGYTQQGHYLKLNDHDSLVIDTRITDRKKCETFHWNSKGLSGNLYKFMQDFLGMNSTDIIEELKKLSPELSKATIHEYQAKPYKKEQWQDSGNHEKIKKYLISQRKLSPKLVDGLIQRDLLRQLKYGEALFVWKKNQKEVGSDIQGTSINHERYGKRGTKKMIVPGSKHKWGFNFSVRSKAPMQKYFIFESPIDALSFYQLYMPSHYQNKDEGYRFLSLNGAGTKLETISEFIKQNGVPDELHLNFDTDKAGVKGYLQFVINADIGFKSEFNSKDKSVKLLAEVPNNNDIKDWNDALQKGHTAFKTLEMNQYIEYMQDKLGYNEVLELALEGNRNRKEFSFIDYSKKTTEQQHDKTNEHINKIPYSKNKEKIKER